MADTAVITNSNKGYHGNNVKNDMMTSPYVAEQEDDIHMDSVTKSLGEMDITHSINNNNDDKTHSDSIKENPNSNDTTKYGEIKCDSMNEKCDSVNKQYVSVEMMSDSLRELSIAELTKSTNDDKKSTEKVGKNETEPEGESEEKKSPPVVESSEDQTSSENDLEEKKPRPRGPGPTAVPMHHHYGNPPQDVNFPENVAVLNVNAFPSQTPQLVHAAEEERSYPESKFIRVGQRSPVENSDDSSEGLPANQKNGLHHHQMPLGFTFTANHTTVANSFDFGANSNDVGCNFGDNQTNVDDAIPSVNGRIDSDEIRQIFCQVDEFVPPMDMMDGDSVNMQASSPSNQGSPFSNQSYVIQSPEGMVPSPDSMTQHSPSNINQNYVAQQSPYDMAHSPYEMIPSPYDTAHKSPYNVAQSPYSNTSVFPPVCSPNNPNMNATVASPGSSHYMASDVSDQGSPASYNGTSNHGSPSYMTGGEDSSQDGVLSQSAILPGSGLSKSMYSQDNEEMKIGKIANFLEETATKFEEEERMKRRMESLEKMTDFQPRPEGEILRINPATIGLPAQSCNNTATQNASSIASSNNSRQQQAVTTPSRSLETCTPLPPPNTTLPHESLLSRPMSEQTPPTTTKKETTEKRGRGRPKGSRNKKKDEKLKKIQPKVTQSVPTTVVFIPGAGAPVVIPVTTTAVTGRLPTLLPKPEGGAMNPSILYTSVIPTNIPNQGPLILRKPDESVLNSCSSLHSSQMLPSCRFQQTISNDKECDPSQKEKDNLRKARRQVADIPQEKLKHQDADGDTVLHDMSLQENYMDFLEQLFPDSPNLLTIGVVKDRYMFRALMERMENEGILEEYINKGNKQKQTPLYLAVATNKPDLLSLLIEKNADPNNWTYGGRNNGYRKPLHVAAEKGREFIPILKVLLNAKNIEVNAKNSDQKTPLHSAVDKHGHLHAVDKAPIDNKETVQILMQHGAEITTGPNERTPLHILAERLDKDFLKFMVDQLPPEQRKEKLNMRDSNGNTCLHIVCSLAGKNQESQNKAYPLVLYLLEEMEVDYCIQNQKSERAKALCKDQKPLQELFYGAERKARNRKNHEQQRLQQQQLQVNYAAGNIPPMTASCGGNLQPVFNGANLSMSNGIPVSNCGGISTMSSGVNMNMLNGGGNLPISQLHIGGNLPMSNGGNIPMTTHHIGNNMQMVGCSGNIMSVPNYGAPGHSRPLGTNIPDCSLYNNSTGRTVNNNMTNSCNVANVSVSMVPRCDGNQIQELNGLIDNLPDPSLVIKSEPDVQLVNSVSQVPEHYQVTSSSGTNDFLQGLLSKNP